MARPQQGAVRAIFVPLRRLARDLGQPGKVNTILIAGEPAAGPVEKLLRERYSLDDLGLTLRPLDARRGTSLESASDILSASLASTALATAKKLGLEPEPVYTYLANTIRAGSREIPYSLVTGDDRFFAQSRQSGILLNDWAAKELAARPGDAVTLDYYIWKGDGRLHTESARFELAGILPIAGTAADRGLAPDDSGTDGADRPLEFDPPYLITIHSACTPDEV